MLRVNDSCAHVARVYGNDNSASMIHAKEYLSPVLCFFSESKSLAVVDSLPVTRNTLTFVQQKSSSVFLFLFFSPFLSLSRTILLVGE